MCLEKYSWLLSVKRYLTLAEKQLTTYYVAVLLFYLNLIVILVTKRNNYVENLYNATEKQNNSMVFNLFMYIYVVFYCLNNHILYPEYVWEDTNYFPLTKNTSHRKVWTIYSLAICILNCFVNYLQTFFNKLLAHLSLIYLQ